MLLTRTYTSKQNNYSGMHKYCTQKIQIKPYINTSYNQQEHTESYPLLFPQIN